MYTQKQFDSLPVWARHEIGRLTANEKALRDKIAAMGDNESPIRVNPYGDAPDLYLPERSIIQFDMQNGEYVEVSYHYSSALCKRIILRSRGIDRLAALPQSSNVMHIETFPYAHHG